MSKIEKTQDMLAKVYDNGSDDFRREVDKKLKEMDGSIIGDMVNELFSKREKKE